MEYSDKPITKPSDDLLGRKQLASFYAKAIDELKVSQDGFVISVQGDWGTGKTSFIELILWYLKSAELQRISSEPFPGHATIHPVTVDELERMQADFEVVEPYILRTDADGRAPHMWAHDSLRAQFGKWIGSEERGNRAANYWQLLKQYNTNSKNLIVRFSPWLISGRAELTTALLSEIARACGASLVDSVRLAIAGVIRRLSEFAPIAGASVDFITGVKAFSGVASAAGRWSQGMADQMSKGPTLEEMRRLLATSLSELSPRKIVVFVDDMDRLTPHEAVEMISLVKRLGNLPNVIYLLSFDYNRLQEMIEGELGPSSRGYLDKIIQYPISLPQASQLELQRLLDIDLQKIFGDLDQSERRRLSSIWYHALGQYLTNLRSVRRFVNAVAVSH